MSTFSDSDCNESCVFPGSSETFVRVRVRPRIAGGSRIEWELQPTFRDPEPYVYRLQWSSAGLDDADDWQTVGLPAEDAYYLVDDEQRWFGRENRAHYRVRLDTLNDVYYSTPVPCLGDLSPKDWRVARAILRAEKVQFSRHGGQKGYLLKRRVNGEACDQCLDPQTEEVTNAQCETCYGTGWKQGYFDPRECIWAALNPHARHEQLDGNRGTANDITVSARMLAEPSLDEEDVWVDSRNDYRWFVHTIQHIVEMRGFPLVYSVELRLAQFTHPVYSIEIPD